MKEIQFHTKVKIQKEYYPTPASKLIPSWYKNLESYVGGEKKPNGDAGPTATLKKCLPVFDAITAGYILYTPADIFVSKKNDGLWYEWADLNFLEFHPVRQAPEHPMSNGLEYPKFMNPWLIKTPLGYSTLFVTPFHRESLFTCMPGIVDTDTYYDAVNFPFVMNDKNFEGLIPAGTPMIQVIPFKRDVWQSTHKYIDVIEIQTKLRTNFFDRYRTMFWHRKEYK